VPRSPDLTETLRQAQRFGFFGAGSIDAAIEHAEHFVAALADLSSGSRVLDLGSGGGLPGLVIAAARGDLFVVLLDRRQKRTDFLLLAASRLGYENVEVRCDDAEVVAGDVAAGGLLPFEAVTARGFGPPDRTVRLARSCLAPHGRIVISEPPSGDRWNPGLLDELDLTIAARGSVIEFRRPT
jgi:16S rRNA (guanine527-N7)-methyltransferase